MNQPPEWPLPADGLRPMPSPYRSVVSSASPDFDRPPEPPPAPEPPAPPEPPPPPEPPADAEEAPTGDPTTEPPPVVATAAVPGDYQPPAASASVRPVPGSYQSPDGRLLPLDPLPVPEPPDADPLHEAIPFSPVPAQVLRSPRRALPPGGRPALPRAISGPPAKAVSGPPARIAAPSGSTLPFPGGSPDRPRTRVPATIVSPPPRPSPRRVRGAVAFAAILVALLVAGLTGYLWAIPVYGQTHANVVAPENLIGLPKSTDPQQYDRYRGIPAALHRLGIDTPLVVVYLATDDPAHEVVFGGAPRVRWFGVGGDLDRLFHDLATAPETAVPDPAATDPGPLGGAAKCGAVRASGTPASICGWQDHGTIAVLLYTNRTPAEASVLLRAMRAELEHRAG